jgi:hypothetical protein
MINQKSGRPAIFIDGSPPGDRYLNSVASIWKLVHSTRMGR